MATLAEMISSAPTGAPSSVLNLILEHGKVVKDPSMSGKAAELISEFIEQVPEEAVGKSLSAADLIAERIAAIDRALSQQVNEIMHAPTFQRLEATWRGLHRMLMAGGSGKDLRIKVLDVDKKELLKDFERAPGFDQSSLFKLIYEEEFGTLGGAPFGVLVTDFEFGRSSQDVRLLGELSHVAASAHAPLVGCVSPGLFDLDSFTDLAAPRDLARVMDSGELAAWRSFRASEDARYVALVLPHVMMRLPYGPDTSPVEEFNFVEDCDGSEHGKYLWGGASWALAERIVASYAEYGWCAAIRGVEGGGGVNGLPMHFFKSLGGDVVAKCPVETAITDRREKELSDLGFIPLCYSKGSDYAVFFGGQTAHNPPFYDNDLANANARLSAMLPYMLAASRFAHYLKAIMRDKVGSFQSRASIESFLNQWVARYVTVDDEASQEVKARLPLREARVEVAEIQGRPGVYSGVIFIRPHFQLEELTASIRLVAELPVSRS